MAIEVGSNGKWRCLRRHPSYIFIYRIDRSLDQSIEVCVLWIEPRQEVCCYLSRIAQDGATRCVTMLPAGCLLLVAIAALGVLHTTATGTAVSSFSDLQQAVNGGISVLSINASQIVFPLFLELHENADLSIRSEVLATLSGGSSTRLFVLRKSKLSLRGLQLVDGCCLGCFGGAIFVGPGSALTLSDVVVSANQGTLGGAFFVDGSSFTAINCTILLNSAGGGGAVLYAAGDSASVLTDCTMSSNSALDGGAVFATDRATVTISDCTMSLNSALGGGGAMLAEGESNVTATGCTISSNYAFHKGGAVYTADQSFFNSTNSTMLSNSADEGGAIQAAEDSTVALEDCTMLSNSAGVSGGAIRTADRATVTTTGCAMISNSARGGGAVFQLAPSLSST